ncbi:MAG: TAT-variant-translocated molybdopterin oxidoreductase [Chloroflexi bacterium]|nr:TAT-variant-translocated molybdopterin oxidoreductase [Chloroflexota bacterium]
MDDKLASISEKLKSISGREYWRSLDELADTPEFQALLRREYPRYAAVIDGSMNRRQFIKVLGASLALAGLSACGVRAPAEKIVPYVSQPEQIVPGKPLYYASALTHGGYARGVLVENHMGRPTKIEGNPDHPASFGATDAFMQAAILSLYDPDRSQVVLFNGQISTYANFLRQFRAALDEQRATRGAGLRILTETVTSPTFANQMKSLLATFPASKWHQYEPATRDNTRAGARLAFGQSVETLYRFDRADVILALDSDFLISEPGSLRYARDFAARRIVEPGQTQTMNRLYVVESSPTISGAKSDHRLPLRAADIEGFARALANALGVPRISRGQPPAQVPPKWVDALAGDLKARAGRSIVIAGESQPPIVHAIAHAINATLGNAGQTVVYADPVEQNPTDQMASLRDLVADLSDGRVQMLMMIGCNPVYNAPADLRFRDYLAKAGVRVHAGLYRDETAALCQWHIPQAHELEVWSDARAYDGTVTIAQPMIAPLYGGKSAHELLAALSDAPDMSGHDIVQNYWKAQFPAGDFELSWRKALHDGIVPNSASKTRTPTLTTGWGDQPPPALAPPPSTQPLFEVTFRTDPTIHDGRYANNGWLQELPKPLTRLTWNNVVLVSPATAERLQLEQEFAGQGGATRASMIELRYAGRALRAPVWITPGQPDDSAAVFLGYGRTQGGRVGAGIGYNAYLLRTSGAPWFERGLELRKLDEKYELASVQQHNLMEGRDLVRATTLDEFVENPEFAKEGEPQVPSSLFPRYKYEGNAWGMAIDLNACIGCNACVVACQAENNVPVVGKDQVLKAREMHWIRIDTYYRGDRANPETYFEPVPCMHCEDAPCEVVCPVAATVHSGEGLNEMVYNRCVGTRYCSNNCPYKVRRFNFLQFSDWTTESLKPMRNPDVSVRSRGVMEKCTYCVQRINVARIGAERENRPIRDGEIVTACAAACPAQAITFGNINDPNSRVAKQKASPRDYALLAELNTHPRTTYEAAVRNPNPELV